MSNDEAPAAQGAFSDDRRSGEDVSPTYPVGLGGKLRRRPALLGLVLVIFCALMIAYEFLAPSLFTTRLDDCATLIPRFSDFVVMIDVDAIEASPAYAQLDASLRDRLFLYPRYLADTGIELGEGNRLRRIMIAGKSQQHEALISFFFDAPVTFTDGVLSNLHEQTFRDYRIWIRRPPDEPVWYYADRTSGLLMVSNVNGFIPDAIDRREQAAAFHLYKEVAQWTSLLDGHEPIWAVFTQLRALRGDSDDSATGRTYAGLVAAPPHRVPIEGGAAYVVLGNELTVRETLVFKTENQAAEYVAERQALADVAKGVHSSVATLGQRLLAVQSVKQDGKEVTVEQVVPLDLLEDLLTSWPASDDMYRLFLR